MSTTFVQFLTLLITIFRQNHVCGTTKYYVRVPVLVGKAKIWMSHDIVSVIDYHVAF